jgi:hypothetical protein
VQRGIYGVIGDNIGADLPHVGDRVLDPGGGEPGIDGVPCSCGSCKCTGCALLLTGATRWVRRPRSISAGLGGVRKKGGEGGGGGGVIFNRAPALLRRALCLPPQSRERVIMRFWLRPERATAPVLGRVAPPDLHKLGLYCPSNEVCGRRRISSGMKTLLRLLPSDRRSW